jgi:hypothetical protein
VIWLLVAVAVVFTFVAFAALSQGDIAEAPAPPMPGRTLGPVPTTAAAPDGGATPLTSRIAADLARECEQFVPAAAFGGDVDLQALWDDLERARAAIADYCAVIATNEPERLASRPEDVRRLRAALGRPAPGTSDVA